jgi:hypothetical protein
VSDFLIAFTTAVSSAAVASGSTTMPSKAVWVMGILSGLLAGARRMQAFIQEPPKLGLKRAKVPDA